MNTLLDRSDSAVWCGTEKGVVEIINEVARDVEIGLPGDSHERVVRALVGDDLSVWVGTSSGLYHVGPDGKAARFTTANGLPDNDVKALALDTRGRLWVGTDSGLGLVDRGAIQRGAVDAVRVFTSRHGLPSTAIRALRVRKDDVWVGTTDGVAELHGAGPNALELGFRQTGLDVRSVTVDRFGAVWIADASGIRLVSTGVQSSPTTFTSVIVDGVPVPVPAAGATGLQLRIPWNAKRVEIDWVSPFAALFDGRYVVHSVLLQGRLGGAGALSSKLKRVSANVGGRIERASALTFPELSRSAYWWGNSDPVSVLSIRVPSNIDDRRVMDSVRIGRLSRRDDLLETSRSGPITLPPDAPQTAVIDEPRYSMEPGDHRFTVSTQGGWPSGYVVGSTFPIFAPAELYFTIVPPPVWVRFWFVGPVAFIAAGLAFARVRVRVKQRTQAAQLRSQIASDLHDSVGASLSRIALLSDVAQQQADGSESAVKGSLAAIGDNARAVIDEMSDAVWFIDDRSGDLPEVLARIRGVAAALFDPDGTRWEVESEGPVDRVRVTAQQRRNIFLIVKEALTNARRHAGASCVRVRTTVLNRRLRIEISDDGGGVPETNAAPRTGGNGVKHMRRRATELGGTLSFGSRPDMPGTHVVVEVPVR